MRLKLLNLTVVLFSFIATVNSQNVQSIKYFSPLPGSEGINVENNIIIQLYKNSQLQLNSLSNLIQVSGTKSGIISGKYKLIDSELKLLFIPESPFSFDEIITVSIECIPSYSYSFKTLTEKSHLARKAYQTLNSKKKSERVEESNSEYLVTLNDNPTDGHIFFNSGSTLVMLDNNGTTVFERNVTGNVAEVFDFRMQPNGLLTYFDGAKSKYIGLDRHYNVVDSFYVGNGYETDFHELIILDNGNALLMAYDRQVIDLSQIISGGQQNANVTGLIIQEIDPDKNVVFQWRSWDHYEITDADPARTVLTSFEVSYVHGNALDIDMDGNLLLSARNMTEITKINRDTGDIIWRLGGKNNEFLFTNTNDRGFNGQHSIRILENGHLGLFDNGASIPEMQYSRGVEFILDEQKKEITFLKEFRANPDEYTPFQGYFQRLDNNHTITGWGTSRYGKLVMTEYDENTLPIFQIKFSEDRPDYSYRTQRAIWKSNLFDSDMDVLDFGQLENGSSKTLEFLLKNNGPDITFKNFQCLSQSIQVLNPFPMVVGKDASILIKVKYTANENEGAINDVLTLTSDTPGENGLEQILTYQLPIIGESLDLLAPIVTMTPADKSFDVDIKTGEIEINFNEPVRLLDNSIIRPENIQNIISIVDEFGVSVDYAGFATNANSKILLELDNDLDKNTVYSVTVNPEIEDFSDNKIDQKILQFSTRNEQITGNIEELSNATRIYPNPSQGWINIDAETSINEVLILDVLGRVMSRTKSDNEYQKEMYLKLGEISGIYEIKIQYTNGNFSYHKLLLKD